MDRKCFFPALAVLAVGLCFKPCTLEAKGLSTSLEESLELRRISEYWKEKDYQTAKMQIGEFLDRYPASSYADQLYAMLGDLNFQDKEYARALTFYEKITDQEYLSKTHFHRLHSLYETGSYGEFILQSASFLKHPRSGAEEINTIYFELAEIHFSKARGEENQEIKNALLKEALTHYNQVMQTKYGDLCMLPVAQIYAQLQEYRKAASLYLLLAKKEAPKQEEHLFQAALLQLRVDKKAAVSTFGSIADRGGAYAGRAAFNQLNLLFQEKRYKDFILTQEKVIKYVPEEKLPLMRYYLGQALFQTHNFAQALTALSESLSSHMLSREQQKNALLTQIACAQEMQDLPLFEKGLEHLKAEFTEDEALPNILLMHTELCRKKREWAKARSSIQELLENCPHHPQRQALMYDNATLLIQEGKWSEGATALSLFLQQFPESSHRASALRHSVHARTEDLKATSDAARQIKQEALVETLQSALEGDQVFSSAEKQHMRYAMGKVLHELERKEEAARVLSAYVQEAASDATCAPAHLLLATCSSDPAHFSAHVTKALSLAPEMKEAPDLHLALFNTYLKMAASAPADGEKKQCLGKAADHLFLGLDRQVSRENRRWLAEYYFEQYQSGQSAGAAERATLVLEKLLNEEPSLSLDKEAEALKLADIYAKTGRMRDSVLLLEALSNKVKEQPEKGWKYRRMGQFKLALAYTALRENEKAIQTYQELILSSTHISSYFATAAALEKAKLEFSLLSHSDRQEDTQAVLAICNALKDIQNQRRLYSEPLHLEAALTYVDIKTQLAKEEERASCRSSLLQAVKESFSCPDDPLVVQYLSAASQFPDKERLYRQYLAYIDAEMLHLSAQTKQAKMQFEQLLPEVCDATLAERLRKVSYE